MDMFLVRNSLKLLTVFDSEGVKIYMSADLCPICLPAHLLYKGHWVVKRI